MADGRLKTLKLTQQAGDVVIVTSAVMIIWLTIGDETMKSISEQAMAQP
jgi:hypothetical protein